MVEVFVGKIVDTADYRVSNRSEDYIIYSYPVSLRLTITIKSRYVKKLKPPLHTKRNGVLARMMTLRFVPLVVFFLCVCFEYCEMRIVNCKLTYSKLCINFI